MTNSLLHPAATLRSAGRSSGLAALLPSPILCCPGPALADMLSPAPLRLCDEHHPEAAPAVVPHPNVQLLEPAAVAPFQLRIGRGASKFIVLEAVWILWNSGLTVAAYETLNEGGAPQHACHRAYDICRGRACAGCWPSE